MSLKQPGNIQPCKPRCNPSFHVIAHCLFRWILLSSSFRRVFHHQFYQLLTVNPKSSKGKYGCGSDASDNGTSQPPLLVLRHLSLARPPGKILQVRGMREDCHGPPYELYQDVGTRKHRPPKGSKKWNPLIIP